MSNHTFVLAATIFTIIGYTAHAQLALIPLSKSEIRTIMFGKLFTGEYPSGSQWAERFNTDGTSDYSENGRAIRGSITLKGNNLCFEYSNSPIVSGGCFEVWKRGANCFDIYSPDGEASLDQRRFGRAWQARGWMADQPNTCLSEEIS